MKSTPLNRRLTSSIIRKAIASINHIKTGLLGLTLACSAVGAHAASGSWNVAVSTNWSPAANWTPGVPGSTTVDSTDIATFSAGLTAGIIVTNDATRYIGGITFGNSTAFGYTISSSPLHLNSGGVIQTFVTDGAHAEMISAPIVIDGTGSAVGIFTGGATASTSYLSIGPVTGSGTSSTSTALTLNGINAVSDIITGSIANGSGGALSLAKSGSGLWSLSGTNTYTGGTSVSVGTLSLLNTNAQPVTGTITVGAGATLGLGVAASGNYFSSANVDSLFATTLPNVTMNSGAYVGVDTTAGNFTYASSVPATTLGLTKIGANTLTLTGVNAYTGNTLVLNGGLTVNTNASLASPMIQVGDMSGSAAVTLTYNNPTGLTLTNNFTFGTAGSSLLSFANASGNTILSGNLNCIGLAEIDVSAGNLYITNPIAGNGGFLFNKDNRGGSCYLLGGGTFNNTYFAVGYGTLNVSNSPVTINLAYFNQGWGAVNANLNILGTTLTDNYNGGNVGAGGGYNASQTTGIGTISISGTSGSPGLLDFGTTYGTIGLGSGSASGSACSGTLNIGNYGTLRTLREIAHRTTGSAALNIDGGTIQLTGNPSIGTTTQQPIIGNGVTTTINAGGATFDSQGYYGIIVPALQAGTGSGGLTKLGSGTIELDNANTYTGPTTISQGTLLLYGGSIADTSAITIAGGATLDVSQAGGLTLASPLTASSIGVSAAINGAGTVDFGTQPITLNYDGTNPALVVTNATVNFNGQTITVNTAQPLANGVYNIITSTSGTITTSGSFILAGTAGTGTIAPSGGNLQMTITGSSATVTATALSTPTATTSYGTSSNITATVTGGGSGSVQFYANGVAFGSPVALSGGSATIPSTAQLSAGTNLITAAYSGNSSHEPSAATSATTLIINPLLVTLSGAKNYDGTVTVSAGNLAIGNIQSWDAGKLALTGTGMLAGRNAGTEALSVGATPTLVQWTNVAVSGSPASYTVTLPNDPIAGDTLIIVTGSGTATGNWVVNVSGGGVTSWTKAVNSAGSDAPDTSIFYAANVPGGPGNRTITVTQQGGKSCEAGVMEYSGLTTSPLDKTATSKGVSGTALSSGTLAATSQANELVIADLGTQTAGTTVSGTTGGYTLVQKVSGVHGLNIYQTNLTAIGTANLTGTASASANWAGVIASFAAASLNLSGPAAGNYTLSGLSANVTVSKTNLTITAVSNTKPYDSNTSATNVPVITAGSIQFGDTVTSGSFIETYDTASAGTGKTLTPSGVVTDGNGGNNYNYMFVSNLTGVITSTVNTNTFTITNSVSGNNLNLSWPTDHEGWRLQVQTNSLSTGLSSVWYDWPNSTNLTSVSIPLNPANPSVFFRMTYP